MAFDPDAYLAEKESFDPDAYLAEKEGMGVMDAAIGVANLPFVAASKIGEEVVGGLSSLGGLAMGKSVDESLAASDALKQSIPDVDVNRQGQEVINYLSEKYQSSPEFIRNIVEEVSILGPKIGEMTFKATGSPALAAGAATLPEALTAGMGLRAPKLAGNSVNPAVMAPDVVADMSTPMAKLAKDAGRIVDDATGDIPIPFIRQSGFKRKIGDLIKSGSNDDITAKFKIDGNKVVNDPLGSNAVKQGFDEGVIAPLKNASILTKRKARRMVDIAERSKKNKRYGMMNRPGDVAGDTLMSKLNIVRKANKDAGKAIKPEVDKMRGKRVDIRKTGEEFSNDLADMGISLSRNKKGEIEASFSGSDIEGLSGPESVINRVIKRIDSAGGSGEIDAAALHQLKRYIDEQVTFGKNAEGLAGNTERVLKSLRANINETLGEKFPGYAQANKQYSDTISVLDEFQKVAGGRMNLTGENADKATGTLMRRLMSNAQSRINLLDSIETIEDAANRYGGMMTGQKLIPGPKHKGMDEDLLMEVLLADELDSVFGPAARTSLQGQFDQAIKQGVNATTTQAGAVDAALGMAGKLAEKARGINEENAFKAIKELLKEPQQIP